MIYSASRLRDIALFMVLAAAAVLLPAPAAAIRIQETRLPNGLRLLHGESHASGLVASAVLVGAGAARETAGMNGAAHFLEHLLFNGTTTRTQEELYRDTDLLGAYSNATTRRDHVAYLMVVEGKDLERGLELQADMLLRSILPPDKFEKERGIIVEEIGKDESNPDHRAEEALDHLLGAGTPEALPVLGTSASIQAMARDSVLAYYHRYYVQSNMTLLVLGDFEPARLRAAVEREFGGPGAAPAPPSVASFSAPTGVFLRGAALDQVSLRIRLPGPSPQPAALAPLFLLEELLNGDSGRLRRALRAAPALEVLDAGAALTIGPGRTFLEVRAAFDSTTSYAEVASRLLGAIAELGREPAPAAELEAARTRRSVSEALAAEQIHYIAFTRAELILHGPTELLGEAGEAFEAVEAEEVRRAAADLLQAEGPAALAALGPGVPDRDEGTDPRALAKPVPPAATAEPGTGAAGRAPELPHDPGAQRTAGAVPPATVILPNGLTVVLAANSDSEVFAVHLAARGRTACEPDGKSGMADLLHRLLPHGAGGWSRDGLSRARDGAGIQLKVTDSPGIPYDDYQTTQDHSFIRLETGDTFYREALALLGAMVFEPALDPDALEEARREAVALAERRAASAGEESARLLRQALYPAARAARPALGTAADLRAITIEDVRAFDPAYFAPANLVVAIVTGLDPAVVLRAATESLGRAPRGAGGAGGASLAASGPCARLEDLLPAAVGSARRFETEIGREQSWIRLGTAFTCAAADGPALDVAALLLSDRMAFELRERQGLAYSIGASLGRRGGRAWLVASMGTRPANLERAEAGLEAEIRKLGSSPIAGEEITKVVKSHTGRMRMRQVTRINQAQALCLEALAGRDLGSTFRDLESLSAVTPDDVRRVASAYLSAAPLVSAIAR